MIRTRIVFAPHAPELPPLYVLYDPFGEVVGRGELAPGAAAPAGPLRDVLIVPGAEAVARLVLAPTRNERQARAAAGLAVADQLAVAGEDLHLALGQPGEGLDDRLAVVVARPLMQAWLDAAALHGVTPQAVIPDYLVPPLPGPGSPPNAAAFGSTMAIRGERIALSVEADLLAVVLPDVAPVLISGRDLDAALYAAAARPPVDFLQAEFAVGSDDRLDRRSLRRIAILAALVVVSPLILLAAQALRDDAAARRIEASTNVRVAAVLPKGATVTDPQAQASARLTQLRLAAGGGVVGLAAQLFAALENLEGAQLESLILGPEGDLRAQLSYANVTDIEVLRDALGARGVVVREEAAREDGGRTYSDIILGERP